jgi:uncharacterized repeat protein (TIGR01451 family)
MRTRALALAAVLAALAPAAAADAVTTVGSDLSKTPTASVCATSCTAFGVSSSTNAPVAVAPFDGVVVRWRVRSASPAATVTLRTLRPVPGTTSYAPVSTGDAQSVPAGTSTYAARIPVSAGDIIGVDASGGARLFVPSATFASQVFNPPLISTRPPSMRAGDELLVNADIERDADGDGYGDETQDLCPTDPTRHTACLSNLSVNVRPAPAPLTVGRALTYTIKVSNDGPSAAQDVGLTVNLPFSATPLQMRAGRGYCSGAYTITCSLGAIAANDSGTVLLTVRPEVVGTLNVSAQAATSTDETSTDDNVAASDVTVLAPTLRLLDARLSHTAIRVGGRTAIRWYMTDAAAVIVKVQQVTRRGRFRSFGSFPVAGRPGSNAVRFHGRVPRHRRLKPGNYRFVISATTLDGRVAALRHLSFSVLHRRR